MQFLIKRLLLAVLKEFRIEPNDPFSRVSLWTILMICISSTIFTLYGMSFILPCFAMLAETFTYSSGSLLLGISLLLWLRIYYLQRWTNEHYMVNCYGISPTVHHISCLVHMSSAFLALSLTSTDTVETGKELLLVFLFLGNAITTLAAKCKILSQSCNAMPAITHCLTQTYRHPFKI